MAIWVLGVLASIFGLGGINLAGLMLTRGSALQGWCPSGSWLHRGLDASGGLYHSGFECLRGFIASWVKWLLGLIGVGHLPGLGLNGQLSAGFVLSVG